MRTPMDIHKSYKICMKQSEEGDEIIFNERLGIVKNVTKDKTYYQRF